MSLVFDEATHQYFLNGEKIPSVTQLVAPLGDDVDDALELTVEAAAERGSMMHAYIAHRLSGEAEEDFELPEAYSGYAEAVELFLSEHTIAPLLIEQPLSTSVYSYYKFAGTPDFVGEYDDVLSILDYKFVSAVCKSKVGAQLNGYDALCEDNGIFIEALYAIQFLSNGTYRVYPVERDETPFKFTLYLNRYKEKKHPRGRIGGM